MRARRLVALALPFIVAGLALPGAGAAAMVAVPTLGIAPAGSEATAAAPSDTVLRVDVLTRREGALPSAPPAGIRYTAVQAAARVAPTATQYANLVSYLRGCGLTVDTTFTSRLAVDVHGSVASLEQAFGVTIDRYGASLAPTTGAHLPANLAPLIQAVAGLGTNAWPNPAPLANLTLAGGQPASNDVGALQTPQKTELAAATFTSGLTVTGPSSLPAGAETTYHVRLVGPDGQPLKNYVVWPVVSQLVAGYGGPTGPTSEITNAQGEASFWIMVANPASFTLTVAAAPNPKPKAYDGSGKAPTPVPAYASQQPLGLTVTGSPASLQPYTAAQVNRAYDIQPLLNAGANGHGVGVGIVIWNSFLLSDVKQYFALNGGTPPKVTVVPVDGTPQAGDGGIEATLDVERVGGTAPGSHIYVYDAAQATDVFDALILALQQDKVRILSMSWGIPEYDLPDDFYDPFEALFDAAAQEGITCIASSGDTGSKADGVHTGVNVPASSPYVLAVGGTQMTIDPTTGAIASQEAWSPDGSFFTGNGPAASATGGGFSRYYPRPTWQQAPGLPQFWNEPFRGVPDVSLAATFPGYAVILDGKRQAYGGTSASAPTWAGILADIESDLGFALGANVDPLLYAFASSAPQALSYVTGGNNIGFSAQGAWSPVTGLGTPDVAQLDQAFRVAFTPTRLLAVAANQGSGPDTVGHPVTVEVLLTDAYGIPMAGLPVTVTAPQGGHASPGNATTDANGIATFTVQSDATGVQTYVFAIPGGNGPDGLGYALSTTFSVNWQPPAPPATKPTTHARAHGAKR